MANLFNGYSFLQLLVLQRGIIASGKLCNHEYFLITIVCKNKKNVCEKIVFLFRPIYGIFCRKPIAAF